MNDFDTWLVQYRRKQAVKRWAWRAVGWVLMILSAAVFLLVAWALVTFAIVTFG